MLTTATVAALALPAATGAATADLGSSGDSCTANVNGDFIAVALKIPAGAPIQGRLAFGVSSGWVIFDATFPGLAGVSASVRATFDTDEVEIFSAPLNPPGVATEVAFVISVVGEEDPRPARVTLAPGDVSGNYYSEISRWPRGDQPEGQRGSNPWQPHAHRRAERLRAGIGEARAPGSGRRTVVTTSTVKKGVNRLTAPLPTWFRTGTAQLLLILTDAQLKTKRFTTTVTVPA